MYEFDGHWDSCSNKPNFKQAILIFNLYYSLTLCTYNEQGQLTCLLCKWVVRSEAVWALHVNSKKHKENIGIAKKLKERTNNFTTPLKRPLTPPLPEVSEKKIKGILKHAKPSTVENSNSVKNDKIQLPTDFFDAQLKNKPSPSEIAEEPEKMEEPVENKDTLPEGFFDDPKLDAKVLKQQTFNS